MPAKPWIPAIAIAAALVAGVGIGSRLGGEPGATAPEPSPAAAAGPGTGEADRTPLPEPPRQPPPEPPAPAPAEPPPPPPAPVEPPAAVEERALPAAASAGTPAGGDDRGERYWRERTAAARERLVATYEACLAHARAPYKYVLGEGRALQIIDASAFAEARAAFISAQSSLRFLREEARRAGALPGWVRVDWNTYPRTPSPEDATCERVLPEEIRLRR